MSLVIINPLLTSYPKMHGNQPKLQKCHFPPQKRTWFISAILKVFPGKVCAQLFFGVQSGLCRSFLPLQTVLEHHLILILLFYILSSKLLERKRCAVKLVYLKLKLLLEFTSFLIGLTYFFFFWLVWLL